MQAVVRYVLRRLFSKYWRTAVIHQVAGNPMPWPDFTQCRRLRAALLLRKRTASGKTTAYARINRAWRITLQADALGAVAHFWVGRRHG